jgi:hypothetical protein
MGLRPTQGDEKRLGPATTPYRIATLSLSSRLPRRAVGPSEEICSCPRNHESFTQTKAKETQRNRRSLRPRAHGAGNSSRSRPGSLLSGAHIAKGAITGCGKTQFCIRVRLYRLRKN